MKVENFKIGEGVLAIPEAMTRHEDQSRKDGPIATHWRSCRGLLTMVLFDTHARINEPVEVYATVQWADGTSTGSSSQTDLASTSWMPPVQATTY